jgi:drug/metabolite transporter (DMT)-like permease
MLIARGQAFGLGAALAFSLMVLCVKLVSLPAQEIIVARSLIIALAAWISLRLRQILVLGQPNNRRLLVARSLAGYAALSAFFFSVQGLPVGVAALIQYMSPLFASVVAFAFMREEPHWRQWASLGISLAGVGVISHLLPTGQVAEDVSTLHLLTCLFSSFLSGVAYVLVRKLSNRGEEPDVIVFYFPMVSLPLALFLGWHDFREPDLSQWWLLIGVGLTAYAGQVLLSRSLRAAQTATSTNMLYFSPVFASLWGAWFLDERLDLYFLVGAAMILGSQIWAMRR